MVNTNEKCQPYRVFKTQKTLRRGLTIAEIFWDSKAAHEYSNVEKGMAEVREGCVEKRRKR